MFDCESLTNIIVFNIKSAKNYSHPLLSCVLHLLCDRIFFKKTETNLFPGHKWRILADFSFSFWSRDVIHRLCNKDRDQGPKGIGVIGIDRVVTNSTSEK